MKLYTQVEISAQMPVITYEDGLMFLGSCFADSLGQRLEAAKFKCEVNPYGTLYNPFSIYKALEEILTDKQYTAQDLFFYQGCWHSPMHHGDFSGTDFEEVLNAINGRLAEARGALSSLKHLFVTFGSAWVYEMNGEIVSNCHKLPEKEFVHRRLNVNEIVDAYSSLLNQLFTRYPHLDVVFTVSPIRHLRDGLHGNQLSKATLLLAIEQLQEAFPGWVYYFPAYELMMDEWRDYRFYAEDMVHPSQQAVQMIWERFCQVFMDGDTHQQLAEVEALVKMLGHKPLHKHTAEYESFLRQILLKIDELKKKYPYFDWSKEKELCLTQLNK